MKWRAFLEVDEDLIEGRDYIRGDNDIAARAFLNTAFETFDLLGDFPENGSSRTASFKETPRSAVFRHAPAVQPVDRVLSRHGLRDRDRAGLAREHELETVAGAAFLMVSHDMGRRSAPTAPRLGLPRQICSG